MKHFNSVPFLLCLTSFLCALSPNLVSHDSIVTIPLAGLVDSAQPKIKLGAKIPDLTFRDIDGKDVKLRDLAGRYVMLYFSSDCTTCSLKNVADLDTLYAQRADTSVLIVSPAARKEMLNLRTERGYKAQLFSDVNNSIQQQFKVNFLPRLYVFNRKGNLCYIQPADATAPQIKAEVQNLVGVA